LSNPNKISCFVVYVVLVIISTIPVRFRLKMDCIYRLFVLLMLLQTEERLVDVTHTILTGGRGVPSRALGSLIGRGVGGGLGGGGQGGRGGRGVGRLRQVLSQSPQHHGDVVLAQDQLR